jgi:hypothetical protein
MVSYVSGIFDRKKRDVLEFNQRPIGLQPIALPLRLAWFFLNFEADMGIRDVAQMVERMLSMHEAQGPIPCFSNLLM